MSFTRRYTGEHVEGFHVFSAYEGEGQRLVGLAFAGFQRPDGHVQFPDPLDWNELELLSDEERGRFGMTWASEITQAKRDHRSTNMLQIQPQCCNTISEAVVKLSCFQLEFYLNFKVGKSPVCVFVQLSFSCEYMCLNKNKTKQNKNLIWPPGCCCCCCFTCRRISGRVWTSSQARSHWILNFYFTTW